MDKRLLGDYLKYDKATGRCVMNPEQKVRDQVEKDYWKMVLRNMIRDWRLYFMLVPMLFIFFCWRYLPMYELLASFKVNLSGSHRVADMEFAGSTISKCCSEAAVRISGWLSGTPSF